jgi:hypothetical protein
MGMHNMFWGKHLGQESAAHGPEERADAATLPAHLCASSRLVRRCMPGSSPASCLLHGVLCVSWRGGFIIPAPLPALTLLVDAPVFWRMPSACVHVCLAPYPTRCVVPAAAGAPPPPAAGCTHLGWMPPPRSMQWVQSNWPGRAASGWVACSSHAPMCPPALRARHQSLHVLTHAQTRDASAPALEGMRLVHSMSSC